jgi:hypothetical protein
MKNIFGETQKKIENFCMTLKDSRNCFSGFVSEESSKVHFNVSFIPLLSLAVVPRHDYAEGLHVQRYFPPYMLQYLRTRLTKPQVDLNKLLR